MRQSVSERVLFRLFDPVTGLPVNGVAPADILNGNYTAIKADGTTHDVALVANTNWFDVGTALGGGKAPGTYQLLVAGTENNVLGDLGLSIQPTAAKFFGQVLSTYVTDERAALATAVSTLASDITSATSPLATSTALSTAIATIDAHTDVDAASAALSNANLEASLITSRMIRP